MNFIETWLTAEQKALEFSKRPALKRFVEVCVNIIHTVFLLLVCILVFMFLLTVMLFSLIPPLVEKAKQFHKYKRYVKEDQVTEVSEKDLYPQNTSEPEVIKKMRDAGQL